MTRSAGPGVGCLSPGRLLLAAVVAVPILVLVGGCVALLTGGDQDALTAADPSQFRLRDFRCAMEPEDAGGAGVPTASGTLLNAGDEARSFVVRIEAVDVDRPDQPITWNVRLDLEPGQSEEFDVPVTSWTRGDPLPDFDPLFCRPTVYAAG